MQNNTVRKLKKTQDSTKTQENRQETRYMLFP